MSYVDDLIRDINDLTRRIGALERVEIPPVPSIVPTFSGTPAANAIAYWTVSGNLAGTVSGSGMSATRNLTAASTDGPVVSILQDHASDDQPALQIINDAVEAIRLDSNTIGPYMTFYLAGVIKAYLGLAWGASTIIAGAAAGDLTIRTTAGKILFSTDNGTTAHVAMSGSDVAVGATSTVARLRLNDSTQAKARLLFSGQEFFQAANTDTEGVSFLLGVNRTTNRQLWIGDSARLASSATNPLLRILLTTSAGLDALATDGSTALPLSIGGSYISITNGRLQVTGNAVPAAGAGIEFGYASSIGNMSVFDRTGAAWKQMDYGALLHTWNLSGSEAMRLNTTGLGVGTTAPQGKLHGHDGTGGFLFVSKTAIVGVAQTIIPDGTGDILKYVRIFGVYDNSASQVGEVTTATAVSGTSDITQDAGTNTLRFSVSAGGALTVIRQAGSATWNVSIWVVWK